MAVRNIRMFRQAIETKFLGPTETKGSRVKALCQAGSITLSWDHSLRPDDNHAAAAQALADKMGWEGDLFGGGKADGRGDVFVFIERHLT
jgi:hypothetical protein